MYDYAYSSSINEYNEVLSGIRKKYTTIGTADRNAVIAIGRYAFEYYMHWSPMDIKTRLTKDVLKKLKLDKIFKKYFPFPKELDENEDLYYYAHILYPDVVPYDIKVGVLRVYEEVCSGQRTHFTCNYFNDEHGMERAEMCLLEAIKKMTFADMYDMYKQFAENGREILSEAYLTKPLALYYENSPLQYLHSALPSSYKSLFLYNYFVFLEQYKNVS